MGVTMTSEAAPRPIRLGVIGTGLAIEKLHWPALRRLSDRFRVVAFANHTRPKAGRFAATAGLSMNDYHADYRDLLRRADVEAVLIALPIPLNEPATRASLAAGKHVLCEKPTGADRAQMESFLGLERQFPGRVVLVGENFFYRDDLRLARSLLDAGAIGRPHLMAWRRTAMLAPRPGEYTGTPWRQRPAYVGGAHLDGGVHHLAQIRLLCGDADLVHGGVQEANPTMGGPSDLTLNLRFAGGAIGNYTAIYAPFPLPDEDNAMRLYGADGVMTVADRRVTVHRPDGTATEHRVEMPDGGYYNELLDFHDAVVHGEPAVGTIAQSARTMELVLLGLESAAQGRALPVTGPSGGPTGGGVPLWRPRGAAGLFDGLPVRVITEERRAGEPA
jgi:predicted dehydrogenase